MSFQDAVRTCLQQKYANFSGRARRSEYWYFQLLGVLANVVWLIGFLIFAQVGFLRVLWALVGIVALLGLIIPGIAVFVRRLHDTDKSGWWWLLGFVPFGGLVLLVFSLLDSGPENRYGPSPKAVTGPAYPVMPPPAPQF
jgi:uncharacterized membrane protein YhaH (DUF805 family)